MYDGEAESSAPEKMENRPETRIEADIPVRIWGMDADGRPFFQSASAGNISSDGAMISRVNHKLKTGDIIGIQYGDRKARFRIIWVVDGGLGRNTEAGVQILEHQTSPWLDLAKPIVGNSTRYKGNNKRRFTRHKVLFPIEIAFHDHRRAHMQTNATDIGGRGCYVETLVPLTVGTEVIIIFWMDSEKIRTTGVVRASDPGVGMGIEFTTLDTHIQERLQSMIERMDESLGNRNAAKGASNSE